MADSQTQRKTTDTVFEAHIGTHPREIEPDAVLTDIEGVTEDTVLDMFVEFNDVIMPIFPDPDQQRTAMREGMRMDAEALENGKLKNLQVKTGGPWTRQRVSALLAGWIHELPGDNGSS
ncbi:MAG: hypothetical protein HOG89_04390 [Candidatus Peribacter sp.]|jgi:hypothetical protein|nr:hypothetical protein [Candidatus Peribacter sp.]MBT4393405.1 hypothetical protein [Candidatus Peribacter sp.]MBT4600756.1 hypothetical protein [Candidatus Peribacter sp.]MBT5149198.1 hypothetical protein [Candidatus Peribacter sp.]MBT5637829.1 hypothetical protein [Candidatus Peribacter sp.]